MGCILYQLPPEIRAQIFHHSDLVWNGTTPNLIKALRPNQKLYNEALGIFFRGSTFRIHRRNEWSFGDMTKTAVLSITKIKILIGDCDILRKGLFKIDAPTDQDSIPSAVLSDAVNVREIIIETNASISMSSVKYGSVDYHFNYFLRPFKSLDRVEFSYLCQTTNTEDAKYLHDGITAANSYLKVKAKLCSVYAEHDPDSFPFPIPPTYITSTLLLPRHHQRWFWQAEKGSHLKDLKAIERVITKPASFVTLPVRIR